MTAQTEPTGAPPEILIVDDNPAKLTALSAALDGMDIEIVTATSGTEALHQLLARDFAAVLLDVNMPVMDGFETATMIRSRPSSEHLPILFITAEALSDDSRIKGYELGAVDYILSPVLSQILRAKVAVFADLYRLREQSTRYGDEMLKKNNEIARQNRDLERIQIQLNLLNMSLEDQVRERTAALQESEERYHVLMETAGEAIICIKAPDTITLWNKKAEALFGYTAAEVIGKDLHQLITPERYRAQASEGIKAFYQTGTGAIIGKTREVSALRRDGSEFPIELSVSAMRIKGEWQATGIISDITERKRLQEKLETARQREQEARAYASMERISRASQSSVTEQAFGVLPLRESAPDFFDALVQSFKGILHNAVEQRVLRVDYNIGGELRRMAEQLGAVKAGPRDAIDIYLHAFKALGQNATAEKTQAYAEESRLLVLELMGDLVAFYRKYFSGGMRKQAEQIDSKQ